MHEYNIKIQHEAWTILPLHHNDVFLMEAISKSNLTNSQLEQVNACHMFLQIMTLAEMVDHMGTTILPQALKPSKSDIPEGLTNISTSKLNWPCIHPPLVASWRLWNCAVCNLFMGTPAGTKLQHPLGAWTKEYNTV